VNIPEGMTGCSASPATSHSYLAGTLTQPLLTKLHLITLHGRWSGASPVKHHPFNSRGPRFGHLSTSYRVYFTSIRYENDYAPQFHELAI